ncbi:MAG: hypothetical protein J0M08_06385 [Bacteroidetes bacterium]|nr:hypothetical protein [Bacteroidota bacterium]
MVIGRYFSVLGILFLSVYLFSIRGNAQSKLSKRYTFDYFSKKKICVGVAASGNWFRNTDIGTLNLKTGFFPLKCLNVGIGADYKATGTFRLQKALGTYARYYFMNKRISTFAEANCFLGKSEVKSLSVNEQYWQIGGSLGVAYTGILNRLGVEVF